MIFYWSEHAALDLTAIVDARLIGKNDIFPQIRRNIESFPGSFDTFFGIGRTYREFFG